MALKPQTCSFYTGKVGARREAPWQPGPVVTLMGGSRSVASVSTCGRYACHTLFQGLRLGPEGTRSCSPRAYILLEVSEGERKCFKNRFSEQAWALSPPGS